MASLASSSLPDVPSATSPSSSPTSISRTSVTSTATSTPIPITFPSGIPLSRWVAIDDSDTDNIRYIGNWTSITNTTQFDNYGNYGTPYQGTLHSITNGTGGVVFTINSTRGEITGTTKIANTSGVGIDPQWFCTIDDFNITPDGISPQAQNNWPLCDWHDLSPGVHVIVLNVTSNGQPFFFDRMSYVPPAGKSLVNDTIIVPWSDSAIDYDSSWAGYNGTSMMAATQGATCSFSFEGTAVEWYASLPSGFVQLRTPSSATYSIDDAPPVFFKTGSLKSSSPSQFNQLQLKTPELAAGSHTLTVQFLGDTSTAPLFLESLIVYNGVMASTSSISTDPAGTTSSIPWEDSKKTPMGLIIGAAVGGLVVLIIILLTICYFLYKARQRRRLSEQLLDIDEPLPPKLHPFTLEPNDIVKDEGPSFPSHSPDIVQRPQDSTEKKPPYPALNRSTMLAPPNFQLGLQIQNALRSESDLSDASPEPPERPGAIVHRDSGIRLIEGITPPVEYPPVYTLQ